MPKFTVGFLAFYAPIEIWYSLPRLWDPFFLVDLIGIMLLAWGAIDSRRAVSQRSLSVLVAGYAWTGANFWRAMFDRVFEIAAGSELNYGWLELCFTGCVMIGAITGLVWSLALVSRPTAPL
jgi:hypothetical protein